MALPSSDNPPWTGGFTCFVSVCETLNTFIGYSYRAICVEVVAVVSQGDITRSQAVVRPQDSTTVADLMEPFDADHARDLALSEDVEDVVGALRHLEVSRVPLNEAVD